MLTILCIAALGYQLVALVAVIAHWRREDTVPEILPPISILKPVHGLDPDFYEAILSHATQNYPQFEIIFGVSNPDDPAIPIIERLQSEFPNVSLVRVARQSPNRKVGVLIELAARAQHATLLVNDSDIHVQPNYLRSVVAPLQNPEVGLVTCLYRARANKLPGIWEALGIATDFAPSTLVAPLVGVKEFGLGSTLVFRSKDLAAIGGFPAIEDYLADDYQLAKRITALGKRVHLSKTVVETSLSANTWSEIWSHQVRWHRTIRVSRGAYAGLFITQASTWAAIAALSGMAWLAAALLIARYTMGLAAGIAVLHCPITKRYWPLIPLRDLWGTAVWITGLTGTTVQWRDRQLQLLPGGRIKETKER
jgi:ceramide glucosyltransferase